ncbi:hypothetical protein R2083_05345 [Nitrosomonas sp. Is35]|uniref:hypothetical protein n=1 Tax=Nitrosomonas sp. Is35 TaxID=3080534 RepID=UPI00294AF78C|nr:hypothetical protein [Nitrosomonas sp. Is35]MDV6346940.1 hypothetical protein [Nitrosomonas sp. Is35]
MQYSRFFLLILLFYSGFAFQASSTCPEVLDYECLVKNSQQVYQEDSEQWWKIYHHTAAKAKKCENFNDVTLFLRLWSGSTDGEMAEGLAIDTEEILIKNSRCFFEGALGLPKQEMATLITRFCPLTEPEPIVKALKQAIKNARYGHIAEQLLQQVEREGCQSHR